MIVLLYFLFSFLEVTGAVFSHHLRASSLTNRSSLTVEEQQTPTFPEYVETVTSGRGIWKWNNALVAYERHMARFKQRPVKLGEVGVWSGGSLLMWHAVLGEQCHVFGLDIAQDALQFQDNKTTIAMVDQGDPAAWSNFFQTVTPALDVLVDDGTHAPGTMLTTVASAWPHLSPGGVLAIEDINGAGYLETFLLPVAQFFGAPGATLASIHMYPLVLIAEKGGTPFVPVFGYAASATPGAVVKHVTEWQEMDAAIATAKPGSFVVLENATWGNVFLYPGSLDHTFKYFIGLYTPAQVLDTPVGCATTNTGECTFSLVNSQQQDMITGVHVFPQKLIVEIAASKPVIQAVRHGTEWVKDPKL